MILNESRQRFGSIVQNSDKCAISLTFTMADEEIQINSSVAVTV